MNTINLPDKYQIPILEDELKTIILSYTYYKGKCSDDEFSYDLKIPKNELQERLAGLYSSKFLRKTDNHCWKCTEKTISFLEIHEFGNNTTELLLEELNIEEKDKIFIIAFLDSDYKDSDHIPSTVVLRAVKLYSELFDQLIKGNIELLTRTIYALLLGSNQGLTGSGSPAFVSKIINWHKERRSKIWSSNELVFHRLKEYWINACEKGQSYFSNSNQTILKNRPLHDKREIVLLSCRLFCYTEDRYLDPMLKRYFDTNENGYSSMVNNIVQSDDNRLRDKWVNYFFTKHDEIFDESIKSLFSNAISPSKISPANNPKHRGTDHQIKQAESLIEQAFSQDLPAEKSTPEKTRNRVVDKAQIDFAHIYRKYYSVVHRFILKIINDQEDAQDIATEAFIRLWSRRKDFGSEEEIINLLMTSARNACFHLLRQRQQQEIHLKDLGYLMSFADQPDPLLTDAAIITGLSQEIEKLPPRCKDVFKLIYYDQLTTNQVAKELNINPSTVHSFKSKAIRSLRAYLRNKDLLKD